MNSPDLEYEINKLQKDIASKIEVNDDSADSADTTYSAEKIEERITELQALIDALDARVTVIEESA